MVCAYSLTHVVVLVHVCGVTHSVEGQGKKLHSSAGMDGSGFTIKTAPAPTRIA